MTARTKHIPDVPAGTCTGQLTSLEAAAAHVAAGALRDGPSPHQVGLELEFHLVDLRLPSRRLQWQQVQRLLGDLDAMPCGSSVTAEPGGQLELSGPPAASVSQAVAALRTDSAHLRGALAEHGFGVVAMG